MDSPNTPALSRRQALTALASAIAAAVVSTSRANAAIPDHDFAARCSAWWEQCAEAAKIDCETSEGDKLWHEALDAIDAEALAIINTPITTAADLLLKVEIAEEQGVVVNLRMNAPDALGAIMADIARLAGKPWPDQISPVTDNSFERELESVLVGMERNGYLVEACTRDGMAQGLLTRLPDNPLPWGMDAPLFAKRDEMWKRNKARFLIYLVKTGRETRA